ncbi:MAG: hypothetical protein GX621_05155, partial [Pirellulaceae bacterium]|nr:hypothetical protein [Pirellulaceae bacterium]
MPFEPHPSPLLARFLDACEPYVVDLAGRPCRSPGAYLAPARTNVPENPRAEEAAEAEIPAAG